MSAIEDIGKRLTDVAVDHWHSRTGLAAALALVFVFGIFVSANVKFSEIGRPEWAFIILALFVVVVAWSMTRIARAPRDHVGFGVAIEFETPAHAKGLRADFILVLRDLLLDSRLRHKFRFIEYPHSIAKRVNADEQGPRWLMKKGNLHFLIHGRARLRSNSNEQVYVLDLKWAVRHALITLGQSAEFATDASRVFPSRLIVDGQVFVCEAAAKHVDAVARYVIGTAAFVSGDFIYSEQLLRDAEAKLKQYLQQAQGVAPLTTLLSQVRQRLVELYEALLRRGYVIYLRSRDKTDLQNSDHLIQQLREYDRESYSVKLQTAICAFILHRDVATAKQQIDACRDNDDAAWQYSKAFLLGYEGDLDGAYRAYRGAFNAPMNDVSIPNQCEEFIQCVMDEEPHQHHLHYCLGLINHRAKGDLEAAKADFERFVTQADAEKFAKQIDGVKNWIEQIDAQLRDRAERPPAA